MLPAFGLHTHIQANRWRSVGLILGLVFLVYVLAFALALATRATLFPDALGADPQILDFLRAAFSDLVWLAPATTCATLLWVSVSYWLHQPLLDAVTGAKPASSVLEPRLYHLLETLCISRGMTPPKLKIAETEALNAFASGLDDAQYAITVTRGLLNALDEAELEAVLAHELTHIRNEDVRLMVVATVIAGIISFVGELVFRRLPADEDGDGGYTASSGGRGKGGWNAAGALGIALTLLAIAWALSLVIRFALSRSREFLADAGAVELTKNPDAMIAALLKIDGRGEIAGAPSSVMEMCVDNPRSGFADLFATHPPIGDRIEALVRFAGGQRPGQVAAPDPDAALPAAGARPVGLRPGLAGLR